MKNLMYKEFRLAAHPTTFIFLCFSAFLLIPNYPYLVTFFYTCLGIFFVCLSGRENHDVEYTVSLPIEKTRAVAARICFASVIELLQLISAIPFALIRRGYPEVINVNQAGSAASFTMFGLAFIMFGLFNLTFFPAYYKNPDKVGRSFTAASIVAFLVVVIDVVLANIPALKLVFTTYGTAAIGAKLGVLFGGMAVGAALTFAAYRLSVKRFDKIDL